MNKKIQNRKIKSDTAVRKGIGLIALMGMLCGIVVCPGLLHWSWGWGRGNAAGASAEYDCESAETSSSESIQASIAAKILRFHVLANSDSDEDQELKLMVRDAVGEYLEPLICGAEDLEETKKIVSGYLSDIESLAESVIVAEGYTYEVSAELTVADFPEKTYGDYTFPAGEYEALELIIGEGEGHNWWCVLYPNMCFRGSVYEVIDGEAEEELRRVLSAEEYEEVFSSGEVEVRFRLWDYITGIFKNL